mmetsp:Transcript_48636/g.152697  ORF Transcript_48636/g.152697 Transcript_48636/m.152697 type:complete len:270 (-) Transcript_48636:415-1224(-)
MEATVGGSSVKTTIPASSLCCCNSRRNRFSSLLLGLLSTSTSPTCCPFVTFRLIPSYRCGDLHSLPRHLRSPEPTPSSSDTSFHSLCVQRCCRHFSSPLPSSSSPSLPPLFPILLLLHSTIRAPSSRKHASYRGVLAKNPFQHEFWSQEERKRGWQRKESSATGPMLLDHSLPFTSRAARTRVPFPSMSLPTGMRNSQGASGGLREQKEDRGTATSEKPERRTLMCVSGGVVESIPKILPETIKGLLLLASCTDQWRGERRATRSKGAE